MALTPKQNSTADGTEAPTKRGKGKKKPALTNVTPETIKEFWTRYNHAMLDYEGKQKEAQGALGFARSVLKDAKKNGVDKATLMWRYQQSRRTPEEIDRETSMRTYYASLTNLPIGSTLGLFGPDQSVATEIEDERAAESGENDDWDTAHQRGVDDGKAGKQAKSPYDPVGQSELHEQYLIGHRTGTGTNILGLGTNGKASGAAAY